MDFRDRHGTTDRPQAGTASLSAHERAFAQADRDMRTDGFESAGRVKAVGRLDHATSSHVPAIVNAMSVDVEDYFQVSAFDPYISRDDWNDMPSRIEANVDRILQRFASHDVKATFFTLGWVADRFPQIARSIVNEGHELASHGWYHHRVSSLTPESFDQDVRRTKALLEDLTGQEIKGYRAPSYSVNEGNTWAHDILAEAGYSYSSSVAPIKHDHYGIPDAPRFEHLRGKHELLEIPVSTIAVGSRNIPCGGGGWFRLYPYPLSRFCINRVNTQEQKPCVFYFHPWEIDPAQPRQSGLDPRTRFRHYVNLSRMEGKIDRLLQDFSWGRMDDIYLEARAGRSTSLLVDM